MTVARRVATVAIALSVVSTSVAASAGEPTGRVPPGGPSGQALSLAESIGEPVLAELLREVLERNPQIRVLEARAGARAERPAQAGSLPDPMAMVAADIHPPETRVGPRRGMVSLSQTLPWFGKRALRETTARHEAAAARALAQARAIEVLTEARILHHEIAFIDTFAVITRADRDTLGHYEELARARYAAGIGGQQDVIKIQAEITKDETKLLEIAEMRAAAVAALNALRDRPGGTPVPPLGLPDLPAVDLDPAVLRDTALSRRPEIRAAEAVIARSGTEIDLARKEYRPDVTLGLSYAIVGRREDRAGRLMPPEDNGQDDLGVMAGFNIPLRRTKLQAGVREAVETKRSAEEERRDVVASIRRSLDDLVSRIPLIHRQLRLFEDVLIHQAEEALRASESAYATGSVNALDLLDAERVLLEVRTAARRARADYAIALARLEGAIAAPLPAGVFHGDSRP